MEQREELVSRSQQLESTVAQLKAKDGQLYHFSDSTTLVVIVTVTRSQRHLAKAAPNDPPHTQHSVYTAHASVDLSRVMDRLTDTANIGNSSLHLMHSMQPEN